MHTPQQVAKTLKESILDNYESMHQFAKELGVSPTNLSNLVSGKKYVSPKYAFKLSNSTGLDPRYLLSGDESFLHEPNAMDLCCFTYRIKPDVLSTISFTAEEQALVDRIIEKLNSDAFFPIHRIRLDFPEDLVENTTFSQMVSAAFSLCGKMVDTNILTGPSMREFYKVDHGDAFMIYHQYIPFIEGLLIKSNFRMKWGYIEFNIQLDLFDISGWR